MNGKSRAWGEERVSNNDQGQLTIWGRANSVNVAKSAVVPARTRSAYHRIDAGMAFGKNDRPEYLAMNPNGRCRRWWTAITCCGNPIRSLRYLNLAYGKGSLIYPASPKARAGVDRWLDWTLSTLQPVDRPVFWALVRTPPKKRDMVAIQKDATPRRAMADRRCAACDPPLHRGR